MTSTPIDSLPPSVASIVKNQSPILMCNVELCVTCVPCGKDFINPVARVLLHHIGLEIHRDFVEAFKHHPDNQESRQVFASIRAAIRKDETRTEWLECRDGKPFCKLCKHYLSNNANKAVLNHARYHKIKPSSVSASNLASESTQPSESNVTANLPGYSSQVNYIYMSNSYLKL